MARGELGGIGMAVKGWQEDVGYNHGPGQHLYRLKFWFPS